MSEVIEKKRAVILNEQRLALAEQWRQEWVVNAEDGTTIGDIIDPAYWAHVSSKMQQYDHIEVRMETGEWIANLIVLEAGRNWARVYLASKHDFVEANVDLPVEAVSHKVEWKGPQKKHVVIRIADGSVIQEGFSEKSAAIAWMENHIKISIP